MRMYGTQVTPPPWLRLANPVCPSLLLVLTSTILYSEPAACMRCQATLLLYFVVKITSGLYKVGYWVYGDHQNLTIISHRPEVQHIGISRSQSWP